MPSPRLLAILIAAWPGWAAAAPSVEDLTAAAVHDLHLQTELPQAISPPDLSISLPDIVLWAIAAAVVAFLLYRLKDFRWRTRTDPEEWTEQEREAAARQAGHLAQAERLAQTGAFVEAIHELLLEAFRDIRERAGERLADSLTSREVLRTAAVPDEGRLALRAMIQRVELTWFGERAATREDYRACRDHFDALSAALHQARAA